VNNYTEGDERERKYKNRKWNKWYVWGESKWQREVGRKNSSCVSETDSNEETMNLKGIDELGSKKRKKEKKRNKSGEGRDKKTLGTR